MVNDKLAEAKFWEQSLAMMDTERFSEEQINAVKQKITILRALARTQENVRAAILDASREKKARARRARRQARRRSK